MWAPWRRSVRTPPLGERGETAAAQALKRAGYRILERNRRLGRFEVDIIAAQGDTIVFVEVKTRMSSDDPFAPEDNVGYTKRQHLRQAARHYQFEERNLEGRYFRFDIVSVVYPEGARKPKVEILENAFGAEE